jgi:hypothetical protein
MPRKLAKGYEAGVMVEWTGTLIELDNGQPFFDGAGLQWSRLKRAPGPLGTYDWSERMTSPLVSIRIVVVNGRPAVDEVRVTRFPGGAEITGETLSGIPIQEIVENGCQQLGYLAFLVKFNEDTSHVPDEEALSNAGSAAIVIRRKRATSDELLSKVAEIYSDATVRPTRTVAEKLPTSYRSATRYVTLARERGFLPKKGKGNQ